MSYVERVNEKRDLPGWAIRLRGVRFTIRRLMAGMAFTAIVLWLLQYPGGMFFSRLCGTRAGVQLLDGDIKESASPAFLSP